MLGHAASNQAPAAAPAAPAPAAPASAADSSPAGVSPSPALGRPPQSHAYHVDNRRLRDAPPAAPLLCVSTPAHFHVPAQAQAQARPQAPAHPRPRPHPHPHTHAENHVEAPLPATAGDRRHSLPLSCLLPSAVWPAAEPAVALAADPDHAAHGQTVRHESDAAQQAAALRRLTEALSSSTRAHHCHHNHHCNHPNHPHSLPHRPSKSVSASTANGTVTSGPVVVRTYSGTPPREQRLRASAVAREADMGKTELPPVDAFSFDDILKNVEPEVAGALDAIASICASCRYSLSNHYDVHMPPQGQVALINVDGTSRDPDASNAEERPPLAAATVVLHSIPSVVSDDANLAIRRSPDGPSAVAAAENASRAMPSRGAISLGEVEYHTLSQNILSPRETPSPMALIDCPTKRRRANTHAGSHPPAAAAAAASSPSSTAPVAPCVAAGLTALPAPEVLTQIRRAVSMLEDSGRPPAKDSNNNNSLSHARKASLLGLLAAWLPWAGDADAALTSGSSITVAESRLRGLLANH